MKPHITIGVSGGIAAYKTPLLVRSLTEIGYSVSCIVTESALEFLTKPTLETLSGNRVVGPTTGYSSGIEHLQSKSMSSLFAVVPATANFIAKAAHGIADDALTTSFLAYNGPKIIAPAMHDSMWINPATQDNVNTLRKRDISVLGPSVGKLSSGDFGPGRMIEIDLVVLKIQLELSQTPKLLDYSVLIAIGGTQEPIDTVRVITNLSSGKLGLATANGFALSGAKVTVISTVDVPDNPHIQSVIRCKTAKELKGIVETEWPRHDLLVMPAAVSDFTHSAPETVKLTRSSGDLTLKMAATDDILAGLPRHRSTQRVIGFCLSDSTDLIGVARNKLKQKKLDAIVANTPQQLGASRRDFDIVTESEHTSFRDRSLSETASELIKLASRLLPPLKSTD